jgi:hypothetical protein
MQKNNHRRRTKKIKRSRQRRERSARKTAKSLSLFKKKGVFAQRTSLYASLQAIFAYSVYATILFFYDFHCTRKAEAESAASRGAISAQTIS